MLKSAPIPSLPSGQTTAAQQKKAAADEARASTAAGVERAKAKRKPITSDVKSSADGAVSMSFTFDGVPNDDGGSGGDEDGSGDDAPSGPQQVRLVFLPPRLPFLLPSRLFVCLWLWLCVVMMPQ